MALAVRSASSNSDSAVGTAVSVAAPTGTAVGDVVACVINANGATTIADNNGSTPFTVDPNVDGITLPFGGAVMSVFYRRIQSGDPSTYNFTLGATQRYVVIAVAFSDPDPATILDVASATDTEDSTTLSTISVPSQTSIAAGSIALSIGGFDGASQSFSTFPSGYTEAATVAVQQPLSVYYKIMGANESTGVTTFGLTGGRGWISAAVMIKNAGGNPWYYYAQQ